MFWKGFVYIALPPGALLVALLLSGHKLPMICASKALSAPIAIGRVNMSLAVMMTSICSVLALVSYSGLQMNEHKLQELELGSVIADMASISDRRSKAFMQGRNLYASLLGLALWGTAWRLKSLHDRRQLGPPVGNRRQASVAKRVVFFCVGFVMMVFADIPLCRINYNLQLLTFVTPRKAFMSGDASRCKGVYSSQAEGMRCAEFCASVRSLSEERLATILWARRWHPTGAFAARIFDDARGVEQGDARIEELFAKKPCSEVLGSVDKSNNIVNVACIAFALLAVMGGFVALSVALGESDDDPTPGVAASAPLPPQPAYGEAPKQD
mmetsp:Transcript_1055/g.2724  ORF Transcript_1055/g.2724 Transcript_1055/m.2724 type:complete len:327 (-) Transcript_1055:106-1086(-)